MSIPAGLTSITVNIDFTGMGGLADSGTVAFAPPVDVLFPGTAVLSRTPQIATLAAGIASITLVTTDNASLNPSSWGYTVTISLTGLNYSYAYTGVAIPSTYGASVNLATLLPPSVPTPITPNTYGVLAQPNTWLGANTFDGPVAFVGGVTGINGLLDWYNVKAYGAIGNGVHDDTSAIQAAITAALAASPAGGTIYFPAGTYLVTPPSSSTAAFTLNNGTTGYTNLRFVGAGNQVTQIKKSAAGHIFAVAGPAADATGATHAKYISFEHLHFGGNGFTGNIWQCFYADNIKWLDVSVANNADVVLHGVEFWDARLYDTTMELSGSQTANAQTPNVLLECSAAVSGYGASADSVNQVQFIGCRFEHFYTGAVWMRQGTGSSTGVGGVSLVNCKMETATINGGPHLLTDTVAYEIYVVDLYIYSGGFNSGYSTAQDAITWGASSGALTNVFIATGAAQTVANGVTINSDASQNSALTNVTANYNASGMPTGDHIAFGATVAGGAVVLNCTSNATNSLNILNPALAFVGANSGANILGGAAQGDSFKRYQVNAAGNTFFGPGTAATDVAIGRSAAGVYAVTEGSFAVTTAGQGLRVKEGSNAKQGTATLAAGTVTVANTAVTSSSRIIVGMATPGGTVGAPYVSSVTPGTGFTIKSTSSADTSTIAYQIFEPA